MLIRELFASDIDRHIEEVIKVDQTDEDILKGEIDEYQLTNSIEHSYIKVLDRYLETPNKPHEGIGIWVSGFFGSGKSSFAKILGLAIENREIGGEGAALRFAKKSLKDEKLALLLRNVAERIPTDAVVFDVSTDKGVRGNQTLTEIAYQKMLETLGYSRVLDLAELEITLEEEGRLEEFTKKYAELNPGKEWERERNKVAFSMGAASRVIHELDPRTYPFADSWSKGVKERVDVSAGRLAERAVELLNRRRGSRNLIFVIDEVGQFVARDVQKMLDLQGIVQSLGRIGRGRIWLVVTSQEKLNELVGGIDDSRIELARLMDRFPLQVHLEQSDISEVTSRRVLAKKAGAQTALRKLFDDHRGRLADHTRVTADFRLPELTADAFVDLYPLLPYQIDLIIQIVSGLRTRGGTSKHVGGANRTIIKLAQQLLVSEQSNLASEEVGTLARLDKIYDLVSSNIDSDLRAKIESIPKQVTHPMAQSVAKAICLLDFARSIPRTAENIAASLHPSVSSDSVLPQVKEALAQLEASHLVRLGDGGYRIPTPSEDDWDRQRAGMKPKPADIRRAQVETLKGFWQPKPSFLFLDTKKFEASLVVNDKPEIPEGDLQVHVRFAPVGKSYQEESDNARKRSRSEAKTIFWVVPIDDQLDRESAELLMSRDILTRRQREDSANKEGLGALVTEERARERRHAEEVRRLLKAAMLGGNVYFNGNDRAPEPGSGDVGKVVSRLLGEALPTVFDRFEEAAARVTAKDRDALLTADSLHGLTDVFSKLNLLKTEKNQIVLRTDSGPLSEVLRRIEERSSYGDAATGKYLEQELAKEPFGWEFENIRLFVLALLRAGSIEVTSKSQTFDSVKAAEAKETFGNNNVFRQAAFRPKQGIDFPTIAQAADAYKKTFGHDIKELQESVVAREIRDSLSKREDDLLDAATNLRTARLPGVELLESALQQLRAIVRGNDANAIHSFNASHHSLNEAMKRAVQVDQALTEPRMNDVASAHRALGDHWPALAAEPDLPETVRDAAEQLRDLLQHENFFKELPKIEHLSRTIRDEFEVRYTTASEERCKAYRDVVDDLRALPEWSSLNADQQEEVARDLKKMCDAAGTNIPLSQLREQRDLAPSRYRAAVGKMMQILEGERLVRLPVRRYFTGGVETEEQLETALTAFRDECGRLIGAGKKILFE
jgi:hypothetical protein